MQRMEKQRNRRTLYLESTCDNNSDSDSWLNRMHTQTHTHTLTQCVLCISIDIDTFECLQWEYTHFNRAWILFCCCCWYENECHCEGKTIKCATLIFLRHVQKSQPNSNLNSTSNEVFCVYMRLISSGVDAWNYFTNSDEANYTQHTYMNE